MSPLLAHAKATREIGLAMRRQASEAQSPAAGDVVEMLGRAYLAAANRLDEMVRDEASGPAFETDRGRAS